MPVELLWAKGLPLDAAIHRFTVGSDPETDLQLVPFDCMGSAAHARMLAKVGLLPEGEARALVQALAGLAESASFRILPEQEDCHTAIEAELTRLLGDAGKRIHLGRSRNDQVITALRLWMRCQVAALGAAVLKVAQAFHALALAHENVQLPGYTHLRRAMPSTFGQWAGAYAEGLLEELEALQALDARLDRSPLGAAAGFGVPLPLDRAYAGELLGFTRVQRNPVDVMNSRGRHEAALLHWLASVAGVLEKACWDLSLYSTEEFGFIKLPDAFTTGSSIMPQKRNPDVLELARGACRELRGRAAAFEHLVSGLPGSYHRDAQLQKQPLLEAVRRGLEWLDLLARLVPALEVQQGAAAAACTDELYAAHAAYALVAEGWTFRDAYREVARTLAVGTFVPGSPVDLATSLGLEDLEADLDAQALWLAGRDARNRAVAQSVFQWESP
jgi:argininosuccinate lyase